MALSRHLAASNKYPRRTAGARRKIYERVLVGSAMTSRCCLEATLVAEFPDIRNTRRENRDNREQRLDTGSSHRIELRSLGYVRRIA